MTETDHRKSRDDNGLAKSNGPETRFGEKKNILKTIRRESRFYRVERLYGNGCASSEGQRSVSGNADDERALLFVHVFDKTRNGRSTVLHIIRGFIGY